MPACPASCCWSVALTRAGLKAAAGVASQRVSWGWALRACRLGRATLIARGPRHHYTLAPRCVRTTEIAIRLTITLPDDLYKAVKIESASTDQTIGEILANALRAVGFKSAADVEAILASARSHANLTEEEALAVGVAATHAVRAERPGQRA